MKSLHELHAYVFTYRDGWDAPCYERTVSADRFGLKRAWRWIADSGRNGFVCIGCLPPRFYS